MSRMTILAPAILVVLAAASARAEPPLTLEVLINGESFLVESDRAVKLESKREPGVAYDFAIRVAQIQHMTLEKIRFDFDLQNKVRQDGDKRNQVQLNHELGHSILITELSGELMAKDRDEALERFVASFVSASKLDKASKLEVAKPHDRKFQSASARGVVVRYRDKQGIANTTLIYILSGKGFTATCLAHYLDQDNDEAVPLIKRTLDSIRAVE